MFSKEFLTDADTTKRKSINLKKENPGQFQKFNHVFVMFFIEEF